MKTPKKKVMVFGVFDLLHLGHVDFFKQAKKLGDFLIVSVARDVNVMKVKSQKPMHDERRRKLNIGKVPYVDRIVLGGKKDPWPHIVREKPDVIALGYDQQIYVADNNSIGNFKEELEKHGLKTRVVRLKPHWPQVYKSRLLRKQV
jgi:FAD synthetase